MRVRDIDAEVIDACRRRDLTDSEIESLSSRNLFYEYCEWHGLTGWGYELWRLVHSLEGDQDAANAT